MLRRLLITLCMGLSTLAATDASGYVAESPLPTGWPAPGEPGVVNLAELPAYRVAEGPTFWSLFAHISLAGIPMTAPVSMGLNAQPQAGRGPMRFLYPSADTPPGPQAGAVHVMDIPAQLVLRVSWRGAANTDTISNRLALVQEAAIKQALEPAGDVMIFGYNSPMLANTQRTWELALPVRGKTP